jgi:hypothetical protein
MLKLSGVLFFSLFISCYSFGQSSISHSEWDDLLSKLVSSSGLVNYKGFKLSEPALDKYLKFISANAPKNSMSKAEQLAYWINAYNAFTIKRILMNYPVSSINKIDEGKTWDVKWIKIEKNTYSLNDIENTIIRAGFKDPRIHFALNCAAKSCPPLFNKAWTGDKLEYYLDVRTKSFIQNPSFNKIEPNSAELSKLFDWYKDDFGDLVSYINKYSKVKLTTKSVIKFKEYNWALNE